MERLGGPKVVESRRRWQRPARGTLGAGRDTNGVAEWLNSQAKESYRPSGEVKPLEERSGLK